MAEVTARLVPGSVVMVKDGENSGTHALFRNQCLAARRGSLSPAMATLVQNLSPATLATTPMKTVESVVNVEGVRQEVTRDDTTFWVTS